ncbi:unnamed protein product [Vitrella brassicaformis CCMP3155]|uniref:Uncharacterized protein n=1 Tax=Vitrella brassicaformis (strain CCMP3155) TaxID=1169540 RepID=A0A0G4FRZ9_VITBC|nr:unnamed protein product [Vitrella brassicaformis CCMP3155]|eukprot:CEM17421.1 unnamed protein product [Vitrella brassicaformis CCMP3155]
MDKRGGASSSCTTIEPPASPRRPGSTAGRRHRLEHLGVRDDPRLSDNIDMLTDAMREMAASIAHRSAVEAMEAATSSNKWGAGLAVLDGTGAGITCVSMPFLRDIVLRHPSKRAELIERFQPLRQLIRPEGQTNKALEVVGLVFLDGRVCGPQDVTLAFPSRARPAPPGHLRHGPAWAREEVVYGSATHPEYRECLRPHAHTDDIDALLDDYPTTSSDRQTDTLTLVTAADIWPDSMGDRATSVVDGMAGLFREACEGGAKAPHDGVRSCDGVDDESGGQRSIPSARPTGVPPLRIDPPPHAHMATGETPQPAPWDGATLDSYPVRFKEALVVDGPGWLDIPFSLTKPTKGKGGRQAECLRPGTLGYFYPDEMRRHPLFLLPKAGIARVQADGTVALRVLTERRPASQRACEWVPSARARLRRSSTSMRSTSRPSNKRTAP